MADEETPDEAAAIVAAPEAVFCANCAVQVLDEDTFCRSCGMKRRCCGEVLSPLAAYCMFCAAPVSTRITAAGPGGSRRDRSRSRDRGGSDRRRRPPHVEVSAGLCRILRYNTAGRDQIEMDEDGWARFNDVKRVLHGARGNDELVLDTVMSSQNRHGHRFELRRFGDIDYLPDLVRIFNFPA